MNNVCTGEIFSHPTPMSGRHKYLVQHEVNMKRGSGPVDKVPDSQWTNASSNPKGAHF